MTATTRDLWQHGSASGRRWRAEEHRIELRGVRYRLRLVRFPAGWLASVDTMEGPTLGFDSSPYLAVSRAVEPIGGQLMDAMSIGAAAGPRKTADNSMRYAPPPTLGATAHARG